MKRCKFTRRLNCNKASGSDQKVSGFDFQAYQEQNNLIPTANVQQIHTAIALEKVRSPLAKVKRDCKNLQAAVKIRNTQISLLPTQGQEQMQSTGDYHFKESQQSIDDRHSA